MRPTVDRAAHPASAVAVGILLAAGIAEIAGSIVALADGGSSIITSLSQPTALFPLTLVVLIAGLGGRRQRIAALCAASGGFIVRVVLASLLMVPGWGLGLTQYLTVTAGLLTGAGLFTLALVPVLRNRDLADDAVTARTIAPANHTSAHPGAVAMPARAGETVPVSPVTPIDHSRHLPATRDPARWATASTPWPRADETDPDGTLIRPPRR